MDEVHYLADRFRGAVWEEVIIHLPEAVRLVSLSATVSNAEEFGDWLQAVRGDTDVIVSEERPVPLEQHVLVRGEAARPVRLVGPGGDASREPELQRLARSAAARSAAGRSAAARGGDRGRFHQRGAGGRAGIERPEVVELLARQEPAAGDLLHLLAGRVRPGRAPGAAQRHPAHRRRANATRSARSSRSAARMLRDEDLAVLGYWEWLEGLERGVAAHHAGMLPAFKEIVEELFQRKLLKVVFATETLALGVNMPARSVVLEKLEKFNGEARVPITPGEYTQLTGRAGRRGIDVEGHSVIQWAGRARPRGRRLARLAAQLPAELELQPDLQHGREPHRPVRPRAHPPDPRALVRAVPGRPRRGRPRPHPAQAGGVAWPATSRR